MRSEDHAFLSLDALETGTASEPTQHTAFRAEPREAATTHLARL
jgi:hypothetical protein